MSNSSKEDWSVYSKFNDHAFYSTVLELNVAAVKFPPPLKQLKKQQRKGPTPGVQPKEVSHSKQQTDR